MMPGPAELRPAVGGPRVLHILDPEPNGNVGGADLHVVDLACAQSVNGLFRPAVLLLTHAPLIADRLRDGNVQVIPAYSMGKRYTQVPFKLTDTIHDLQPAIIHSHGYDANYFACWARLRVRGPWAAPRLIFTSHGWIDEPSLFVKTTLDLITHKFADHVIVCSPHQIPRARRATGRNNVSFVSNGIPERNPHKVDRTALERRFSIPRQPRIIAFIGRLSPEKRVGNFLEIARHLVAMFRDVHFIVAGGGPLKEVLEKQIEPLGLRGFITFTGVVPDIDSIYQHLELLVLPSATETTSRVTIEAMMWGLPVVASDVGGLPSLVSSGEDGFLCPPDDVGLFVERIASLLKDPTLRARMGAQARQKACGLFSIELMRRAVEGVYLHE